MLQVFAPHRLQILRTRGLESFTPKQIRHLSMATGGEYGHYYQLGSYLGEYLNRRHGHRVDVFKTQGSLENLELVSKRDADFAMIQSGLQGLETQNLRAIANLGRQYVHLVVPADSTIETFADLAGHKVNLGPTKSGFASLGSQLLDYFNFQPSVEAVYQDKRSASEIAQALANGDYDAYFAVYRLHAPAVEDLLADGVHRLVPLPQADAVAQWLPGTSADMIPPGVYGPNRSVPAYDSPPFITLSVNNLLITHRRTSAAKVQTLLETLYDADFIKAARMIELNESNGRRIFDIPIHEAARRFYGRKDPVTADMFEIASFFIAALVFLGSLGNFLVNRRRALLIERQRKLIIPYFEGLLDLSKHIARSDDIGSLREDLNSMMEIQRKAEKEWLEGKLDTEHVENLYTIYGVRSANAFSKIMKIQLGRHFEMLEKILSRLDNRKHPKDDRQQTTPS